jgi:hypothetical protein
MEMALLFAVSVVMRRATAWKHQLSPAKTLADGDTVSVAPERSDTPFELATRTTFDDVGLVVVG